MYDSVLETRTTVTGEFLVAEYRYTYGKLNGEKGLASYPLHDESIHTVLLDCNNKFVGSLATTYLLKGENVRSKTTPDNEVLMTTKRRCAGLASSPFMVALVVCDSKV